MKKCTTSGRAGIGILFLLAGLVFLAGNLGLIPQPWYDAITSWPMILIAIALVNFLHRDWGTGLIFLAIGSYFLLPKVIPGLQMQEIWKFWPILLILIGITFLTTRSRAKFTIDMHSSNEDTIDDVSIFGGSKTRIDSQNFKGGKITSIFGGSEINMTSAKLSDSGASVEFTAIFGGAKMIVPRDWNIRNEVVSIMGGFTDKRIVGTDPANSSKTLLIKGVAIFGGGELISY